jgi:hypothetical protein
MIWGLGIGDWGLGPIPNPQSPIPNLKKKVTNIYKKSNLIKNLINNLILRIILNYNSQKTFSIIKLQPRIILNLLPFLYKPIPYKIIINSQTINGT